MIQVLILWNYRRIRAIVSDVRCTTLPPFTPTMTSFSRKPFTSAGEAGFTCSTRAGRSPVTLKPNPFSDFVMQIYKAQKQTRKCNLQFTQFRLLSVNIAYKSHKGWSMRTVSVSLTTLPGDWPLPLLCSALKCAESVLVRLLPVASEPLLVLPSMTSRCCDVMGLCWRELGDCSWLVSRDFLLIFTCKCLCLPMCSGSRKYQPCAI